jgi:hypothetical protein
LLFFRRLPVAAHELVAACFATALLAIGATASAEAGGSLWDFTPEQLSRMRVSSMDHSLEEGQFLVGYSFMHMEMRGNRDGTDDIGKQEFFDETTYMVQPRWMTMQMHMVHLMYSPRQSWTLMLMLPFLEMRMDHLLRMPMMNRSRFETENDGIGDIELHLHHTLHEDDFHRVVIKGGLGFPSGAIGNKTSTPMGKARFPYPMRLGSGTFSLAPGATWAMETGDWNLGADVEATFQLGKNHRDYRLGHGGALDLWVMRKITPWLALSATAQGSGHGNIHGHDDALNPLMAPTADPDRRAGAQIALMGGLNFFFERGLLKGQRLLIEAGHPVYEWLDGPQLRSRWQVRLDWSFTY